MTHTRRNESYRASTQLRQLSCGSTQQRQHCLDSMSRHDGAHNQRALISAAVSTSDHLRSQLAALRWRYSQDAALGFHAPGSFADHLARHCRLPPHPCSAIHHQCVTCVHKQDCLGHL